MQSKGERMVALSGMSPEKALERLQGLEVGETPAEEVAKAVPDFVDVPMQSFIAKYAIINGDLVVQFFLPKKAEQHLTNPEGRQAWMHYWLNTFPPKLDATARAHFEAEYPRLQAKYTEEVASWWFRAGGFGAVTDPHALARRFLQLLEDALQARS